MTIKKRPILLLAGGKSSRTGELGPKGLILVGKTPWFIKQIERVSSKREKILVLGYHHQKYLESLQNGSKKFKCLDIAINNHPEEGQFSSILVGLKELVAKNQHGHGVFIQPIDTPLADEKCLEILEEEMEKNLKLNAIIPSYKNKKGHPILISKKAIEQIIGRKPSLSQRLDFFIKELPPESIQIVETPYYEVTENLNNKEDWMNINKKRIILKNGTICTGSGERREDLVIEEELISQIGADIQPQSNDQVIDISGCYLFPGGIDAHTHMELPMGDFESSDNFSTGTRAALMGGTTTIIDFANQEKGNSLANAYWRWRKKADGKVFCDYKLHLSITDVHEQTMIEALKLYQEEGVTSFKTFMAYPQMKISGDEIRSLVQFFNKNAPRYLLTVHAEKGEIVEKLRGEKAQQKQLMAREHPLTRPIEAEIKAIEEFINIIEEEKGNGLIVHLTSEKAAKGLLEARKRGVNISTESCPQYLFLNEELYFQDESLALQAIMSPPLRNEENQKKLWNFLLRHRDQGIQIISTDHCPFLMKDKMRGKDDFRKVPNGAPGVEERFMLLFSEGVMKKNFSTQDFVKLIAENPAKMFHLYPQKGVLQVGSDADLVVVNPQKHYSIDSLQQSMNVDYSLYQGFEIQGKIERVYVRGKLVVNDSKFIPTTPFGKYCLYNNHLI